MKRVICDPLWYIDDMVFLKVVIGIVEMVLPKVNDKQAI
jgi:hypothetical protein